MSLQKTMTEEFEKGREYERINSQKSQHLFLGWGFIIMSPIWFFFSVWDFNVKFYGGIGLFVFGLLWLYVARSEKKQLGKIWKKQPKN